MKFYQWVNLQLRKRIKVKNQDYLNTTKKGHEAIDINTLIFVALHELAHEKKLVIIRENFGNFNFYCTRQKRLHSVML